MADEYSVFILEIIRWQTDAIQISCLNLRNQRKLEPYIWAESRFRNRDLKRSIGL